MKQNVVEVLERVYRIGSVLNGRPVYQYLLAGAEHALLVDTGVASTPREVILPAIDYLGLQREGLRFGVITHCDLDHQGGAAQLKAALPQMLITCGDLDRMLVENPQRLLSERYNGYLKDHNMVYSEDDQQWMLAQCGEPQPMDLTWSSGELVRLEADWSVRILQMPGHSFGHLSIFDLKNKALFVGDAVQHTGYRTVEGLMAMPPTYLEVESYLQTIRHMESLELDALGGAHWPFAEGRTAVSEFLTESRRYVELSDQLLRSSLKANSQGMTLQELISALNSKLGDWPPAAGIDLMYSLAGHLKFLTKLGLIAADPSQKPLRFSWQSSNARLG